MIETDTRKPRQYGCRPLPDGWMSVSRVRVGWKPCTLTFYLTRKAFHANFHSLYSRHDASTSIYVIPHQATGGLSHNYHVTHKDMKKKNEKGKSYKEVAEGRVSVTCISYDT